MSNIIEYNKAIETEVANPIVMNSLMAITFKGITNPATVKRAMLEGMIRGFKIEDFLKKKIYATPFWDSKAGEMGYALVESIANVRDIAMQSGQTGKSKPEYEYEDDGSIRSCTVTIWKKDGHEMGYTSTVFFKEYEKPPTKNRDGKETPGMWQTKPHTMIAKVAEMHALRSAFPELAESYIEDEFDRQDNIVVPPEYNKPEEPVDDSERTIKMLKSLKTIQPLEKYLEEKLKISKYDKQKKEKIREAIEERIAEIKKSQAEKAKSEKAK